MPRKLTEGSIARNVFNFSLPYLLAYFLQTLYGLADLYIAGQFNGADVISAVAIGSQIMHMVTVIIIGLIVGVVDEDSFLNRHPRKVRIEMLQQEIANYKRQYTEADNKIHELQTNPKAVEKIARERYYMKRANEDVFVFENNETEQLDD